MKKSKLQLNLIIFICMGVLISSCMTNVNLRKRYADNEKLLKEAKFVKALENVEKSKEQYGASDQALFYLDRGIVNFYGQNNDMAIKDLAESDRIFEELYSQSVTKGIGSFLFNDNLLDYDGEDHENIMVNLLKAISFIKMNNPDAALVEIRRVHEKIQLLQVKYMKEMDELKKTNEKQKIEVGQYNFTDSSLARYLGFLLYRLEGSLDDARIDKSKWADLWTNSKNIYSYTKPNFDQYNLNYDNNLVPLNFLISTNFAPYKKAWELSAVTSINTDKGWSVLTVSGKNPTFKKTYFLQRTADDGFNFKLSIPQLQPRNAVYSSIQVTVDNGNTKKLDLIEDVDIIAMNNFKLKEFSRTFKHLTRAFVKALAANEIDKKVKKENTVAASFFGAIGKGALMATEEADLRTWRLLPSKFYAGEFLLSPGEHTIKIDYMDNKGTVLKSETFNQTLSKTRTLNLVNRYEF